VIENSFATVQLVWFEGNYCTDFRTKVLLLTAF